MDSPGEREKNYLKLILQLLSKDASTDNLYQSIVDAPFSDPLMATNLDLGIVVLLLVDADGVTINRIALSNTEQAANAVKTSQVPFNQIKIPLNHHKNIISKAIRTGKQQRTEDWDYLFTPALSPASARFNQATAGIACSIVQPFDCKPHGGAFICSFFQHPRDIKLQEWFIAHYSELIEEVLGH